MIALPARAAARVSAVLVASLLIATTVAAPAAADPLLEDSNGVLATLRVPKAWHTSKGAGVTVAVLDTGVDAHHQDLRGAVTTGPDLTGVNERFGTAHWGEHGTAMASLIAGRGHDGSGVVGVAPRAHLLSVRVIIDDDDQPYYRRFHKGKGLHDAVARGIRYAVDNGADVISMSLGGIGEDRREDKAVGYAVRHGVVLVASAGNAGKAKSNKSRGYSKLWYPAAMPGVISVAAVGPDLKRASFSSYNDSVAVAAPGVAIPVAAPGGGYALVWGTSPAGALVAGVAALIRSAYPKLSPVLVAQAITGSTRHHPAHGYSIGTGFGVVDAAAALRAAKHEKGYDASVPVAAGSRFGDGSPQPVPSLVRHDTWLLAGSCGLAVLALVGLAVAAGRLTRGTREPDRAAASAPTGEPVARP